MIRQADHLMLATVVLLAAAAMLARCEPCPAHAQDDDRDARALLIVTAHEAGLDSPSDADGIWAVLVRGAEREHVTPATFARLYSRRLFHGTSARPWAAALDFSCGRPRGFAGPWERPRPGGLPSRREACRALVEHVREVVLAPPRCAADDWGNRADHERARALGRRFVMVDCGAALNLFSRRVRR